MQANDRRDAAAKRCCDLAWRRAPLATGLVAARPDYDALRKCALQGITAPYSFLASGHDVPIGYAMSQRFSQKVVASKNVLVRELSGEAVLLNLESEKYFGLDEIGYRMWTVLTASDSIGAAYEELLSEYEVEPEQLRQSLDGLISQCTDQGLLQLAAPE
jgi:Coenzyme PQQ synthesis protein D (PqqD)